MAVESQLVSHGHEMQNSKGYICLQEEEMLNDFLQGAYGDLGLCRDCRRKRERCRDCGQPLHDLGKVYASSTDRSQEIK